MKEPTESSAGAKSSTKRTASRKSERIKATNEMLVKAYVVMGRNVPDAAVIHAISDQLTTEFTDEQIAASLDRVMRECEWLTLKAIIERIPGRGTDDGRPEPETAWAMCPKSEDASVVWTQEMAAAHGIAKTLLDDGDAIAARMAFRETYVSEVSRARREGRPARWEVSLGFDKDGRVPVLAEAVEKGRISEKHALALVGDQAIELQKALPASKVPQLAGEVKEVVAKMPAGIRSAFAALVKQKAMPALSKQETEQMRAEDADAAAS
jgi:hypothetical protein